MLDARTRGLQPGYATIAAAAGGEAPLREMEAAGAGLVTLDQALALVGGAPD